MVPLPWVTAPALEVSTAADAKAARTKSPHLPNTLSPLPCFKKIFPYLLSTYTAFRSKRKGQKSDPSNEGLLGARADGGADACLGHDLTCGGEHVLEPVRLVVP